MDLSGGELAGVILPGLATGLGGLVLLAVRRPSGRTLDALNGLTAGIMFAAAIFSLLVPALERGRLGGVITGFALGVACMALLDTVVPHIHPASRSPTMPTRSGRRPSAARSYCSRR